MYAIWIFLQFNYKKLQTTKVSRLPVRLAKHYLGQTGGQAEPVQTNYYSIIIAKIIHINNITGI